MSPLSLKQNGDVIGYSFGPSTDAASAIGPLLGGRRNAQRHMRHCRRLMTTIRRPSSIGLPSLERGTQKMFVKDPGRSAPPIGIYGPLQSDTVEKIVAVFSQRADRKSPGPNVYCTSESDEFIDSNALISA